MKFAQFSMIAITAWAFTAVPVACFANGLFENGPWRFQTSADRANKAVVLDLIERKKGGFYDSFATNIYNETNIGSQINCNNSANATGNIADNSQAGPRTEASGAPNISSDSTGNTDTSSAGGSAGSVSGGETSQTGSQTNSGDIESGVDDSSIDNSFGDVTNGDTDQALNNDQDNSGNQTAGVDSSTACNLDGATITGNVTSSGVGPLN